MVVESDSFRIPDSFLQIPLSRTSRLIYRFLFYSSKAKRGKPPGVPIIRIFQKALYFFDANTEV